jgi:hypothetical protein
VRPFSQNPQDSPAPSCERPDRSAIEPRAHERRDFADPGVSADAKLDTLLGRAAITRLTTGFAERVIQAVEPASTTMAPRSAMSGPLRAFGLAAALAVCGSLAWWTVASSGTRLTLASSHASAAPTEEEVLLKALANLENSSGDLALVAQLGEVLEAELRERTSWLETE